MEILKTIILVLLLFASPAFAVDADEDYIEDDVDLNPGVPSRLFASEYGGVTSNGQILYYGTTAFRISDAQADGIRFTAGTHIMTQFARISFCDNQTELYGFTSEDYSATVRCEDNNITLRTETSDIPYLIYQFLLHQPL